jgi:hypothetical protein
VFGHAFDEVEAEAREWNERRAAFRREWLHDLAEEMAEAFERPAVQS